MIKPPMPEQPKTKEIPAVSAPTPAPTIAMVIQEVRSLGGIVEGLANEVIALGQRMGKMEDRQTAQSDRARAPSEHDVAAAAELAKERAAREALEKKVDAQTVLLTENTTATKEIRDAVVKTAGLFTRIVTHPKVVFVGKTVWAGAMLYAAAKGLKVLP